jgi:heterotetrameric sarcosine oxidase gamma subunit
LIREESAYVLERQSALTDASSFQGRDGADGRRRLRLGEARDWRLAQVAAFPATAGDLARVLRSLLGVDPPVELGSVIAAQGRQLMKTGPGTFWVVTHASDDMTAALQAVVAASVGAVTPLSFSRTRLIIDGPAARRVLSTGIALDFHPEVFRAGHFAMTGLHHTPILIHRSGMERYELYVMRSFALWTWEWLTDAALQFGYDRV